MKCAALCTLCLLVGCSTSSSGGDPATRTSTTVSAYDPAAGRLADDLLWLLSPTGRCSPVTPALRIETADDLAAAILRALGLAPSDLSSSCPADPTDQ